MPVFDVDAFLDGYKGKTVSVVVCGRADLMGRHTDLERSLIEARTASRDDFHNPEVAQLTGEIRELEQEMKGAEVTFTFAALSHKAWQDLLAKHPPTKQQKAEHGIDHNPETFPTAAIAAAAIEPPLTSEQAERIRDTLTFGEFEKLYRAVLEANAEVQGVPKSVLAAVIGDRPQNGASSTTAAPEGSPDASS